MTDFPYTLVTGKLQTFFEKIQSMGVPESATTKWLPSIGFGSKNDRSIIRVIKFIGFIDQSNKPTQRWQLYRDKSQAPQIMAEGIVEGYGTLYHQYPNAHKRSDEELKNFFRAHSSAGEEVILKTVTTFKNLCSLANFSNITSQSQMNVLPDDVPRNNLAPLETEKPTYSSLNKPSLHIDIQIHIDSDATAEQVDKIFESMATHLYKKEH